MQETVSQRTSSRAKIAITGPWKVLNSSGVWWADESREPADPPSKVAPMNMLPIILTALGIQELSIVLDIVLKAQTITNPPRRVKGRLPSNPAAS